MSIDHTRHAGIFDASSIPVVLIGAGGIGAITAITLAKMGVPHLTIIDCDTVNEVNLATQFHRVSDVGLPKAEALSSAVKSYAGDIRVITLNERLTADTPYYFEHAWLYISAVDSIASRKGIWEYLNKLDIKRQEGNLLMNPWYLDARMGAEVYEHYIVNLGRTGWYEHALARQEDDDFPDLPCTSKATIYTADIAAGHIGAAVRRIATLSQKPGFLKHDIIEDQLSFLDIG